MPEIDYEYKDMHFKININDNFPWKNNIIDQDMRSLYVWEMFGLKGIADVVFNLFDTYMLSYTFCKISFDIIEHPRGGFKYWIHIEDDQTLWGSTEIQIGKELGMDVDFRINKYPFKANTILGPKIIIPDSKISAYIHMYPSKDDVEFDESFGDPGYIDDTW
jgi:hypothetical protein